MPAWTLEVWKRLDKYKYVLLVAAVGVVLLLWPGGGQDPLGTGESAQAPAVREDLFQTRELEEKLSDALSRIEGAGRVRVVLTLRESARQVYAQNGRASEGGGQQSRETTAVLVARGSGAQEAVPLQQIAPVYQGALVVAEGGEDPRVRLALSEAISALTGLGADKISISKGK